MITVNKVKFSHRPQAGISVGIYIHDGVAYMAASFRNQNDVFNRRLARQIICQRIQSAIQDNKRSFRYVTWEPLEDIQVGNGAIMYAFREKFKPDIEETDTLFMLTNDFGGVEERRPISRNAAWDIIADYFDDAVDFAKREMTI
jgi:hypothetical protein